MMYTATQIKKLAVSVATSDGYDVVETVHKSDGKLISVDMHLHQLFVTSNNPFENEKLLSMWATYEIEVDSALTVAEIRQDISSSIDEGRTNADA